MIAALLAAVLSVAPGDATLTAAEASETLDGLERAVERLSSYAAIADDRWRVELARVRGDVRDPVERRALQRALRRILAPIGDGHAGVNDTRPTTDERPAYLPCRLETLHSGPSAPIVALWSDRRKLVADDAPFLVAIDGVDIATWIGRTATEVAAGSPQLVRRRAARSLERWSDWRDANGADVTDRAARLTLADETGTRRIDATVLLVDSASRSAPWPATMSQMLDDGIGYLRMAHMEDDETRRELATLDSWAGLRGLIIDVRGNGGGSRDALIELGRRLLPDTTSVVANAARPLRVDGALPPEMAEGLARRGLRPIDDATWMPSERQAIEAWRPRFRPEPALPDERFAEWHVMTLTGDARAVPVRCPVAVLLDADCFSATDVFLSGLRELPGVTLIGQSSSGGSGASRWHDLPHGFRVRLSSMVSFTPTGGLLDGRGVAPDIEVNPSPQDLVCALPDSTLRRAIEHVSRNAERQPR